MANLLDEASILLTPTAYNNGSMLAVKPENGDGDFTFSRNSSATRVNEQGLVEDVASNLPRIDYTDGCGSLLLEPQSTNLITQSELFSDASWNKSATIVSANSTISADGTQNASLIQSTQTGTSYVGANNLTLTIGNTYTFSCFAKKGNNDWIRLAHISSGGTGCWFDLENGVVGTVNSQSATIEDYGSGWYRCTNTFIATATTNLDNAFIGICDANGSTSAGAIGQNDYLWGAMLEQNSYATSYIPTQGGATSTRLADIATQISTSEIIGQTEGTIFYDINFNNTASSSQYVGVLSDGTSSNRIQLLNNTLQQWQLFISASTISNNISLTTSTDGVGRYKIAISYKSGDVSFYINGLLKGTSSETFTFNNLLHFDLGQRYDNTFSLGNSINSTAVYKTALTDAQLTALTTI